MPIMTSLNTSLLILSCHPFTQTDVDIGRALLKKIFTGFADIDLLSKKPLADGAKRVRIALADRSSTQRISPQYLLMCLWPIPQYHTLVKLPDHRHARRLDLRLVGWHDYQWVSATLSATVRRTDANGSLSMTSYMLLGSSKNLVCHCILTVF